VTSGAHDRLQQSAIILHSGGWDAFSTPAIGLMLALVIGVLNSYHWRLHGAVVGARHSTAPPRSPPSPHGEARLHVHPTYSKMANSTSHFSNGLGYPGRDLRPKEPSSLDVLKGWRLERLEDSKVNQVSMRWSRIAR
jgi:hypothetical protein